MDTGVRLVIDPAAIAAAILHLHKTVVGVGRMVAGVITALGRFIDPHLKELDASATSIRHAAIQHGIAAIIAFRDIRGEDDRARTTVGIGR
jgi:hypothetical protein